MYLSTALYQIKRNKKQSKVIKWIIKQLTISIVESTDDEKRIIKQQKYKILNVTHILGYKIQHELEIEEHHKTKSEQKIIKCIHTYHFLRLIIRK